VNTTHRPAGAGPRYRRAPLSGWWLLVGQLLTGCATPAAQPIPPATSEQSVDVPAAVPPVDTALHTVPLEQVYFDTFRSTNRAVPLSQASAELIQRLRDAIPPIHKPTYQPAAEATWLHDQDLVIGYAAADGAWAYPVRILNYHEIVNAVLGGEPVLISYCPLCSSGIVYDRRLDDRVLTFGNTSALYESDLVMLDYQTGSYWWQVAGQAIVGPLTGQALAVLPSLATTWREWQRLHPSTLVLSQNTGYTRRYDGDPFLGYMEAVDRGGFAFPVSEAAKDHRLKPAARVLAVRVGDDARAYPLAALGRTAVMDTLGGRSIVVFIDAAGPTGAAYETTVAGTSLRFEARTGALADTQTGSEWDLAGRAIAGPLKDVQLAAVPARTSWWFAIVAAEPGITIYQSGEP
jgi:uncharacterized protein DUF3179